LEIARALNMGDRTWNPEKNNPVDARGTGTVGRNGPKTQVLR